MRIDKGGVMGLLDEIKAKADANGDGKVDKADLEALRSGENAGAIDQLESLADQNGDGKITLDDAKSIDLGALGDDIKGKLGGMFGK
jgi:hypothetical protein